MTLFTFVRAIVGFTADFHFGHSNIIRYCNRPFQSVEEMDRTILDRLNDSAKANDILYFLGDFCIGSKAKALEYRKQIRCKKIFAVPGNHDKQIRKLTEEFSWLSNLAEISIHCQPIVICHYAMRVWNRCHHGLPNPPSLSMDDFRPWHFDEISTLMAERVKRRAAPEHPS